MSNKKGPSLLNMIERERHNYSASMTNQDPTWTQEQPQPNRSVAKMFVIMLGIHILVIAGLIMYDFATGTKKQPATAQNTTTVTPATPGTTTTGGQPPESGSSVTPDPRNDTPAITSAPPVNIPAAPETPPLPYVAQPSTPSQPVTTAPASGMPALSPGSSTRVDLEPVAPSSSVVVALPPATPSGAITQPSIDLPPPPPAPAKMEPVKTEPVKTTPVKTEPKKTIVSAPPAKKPEPKKTTPKPAAAPAKVRPSSHTVSRGDTLGAIAKRYGVSVNSLVRANKLKNANTVILGSRLVIPKN